MASVSTTEVAGAAADDRCPGAEVPGFGAVGPAQAEFHDGVALGFLHDAGGLGGDEGLVVDDGQDGGFHQLGLDQGALTRMMGSKGKITVPSGTA